jgi:hypothetical protein
LIFLCVDNSTKFPIVARLATRVVARTGESRFPQA